jgi:hypothetical protein
MAKRKSHAVVPVVVPVARTCIIPARVDFKAPTVSITGRTKITIAKSEYEVYMPEPCYVRNYTPRAIKGILA